MPFWAFAATPLTLGLTAFLMQFMVQGAFGVVPAHLNEMSPPAIRGTFPGFTYQFGNMLAAGNATLQAALAVRFSGNYGLGMAVVAGVGAAVFGVLALLGPEAREAVMAVRHAEREG